ncbi:MAG: SurA N-terminal domain-containing protein, partial [Arsenophonus sp. ER-QC15-MAG3]
MNYWRKKIIGFFFIIHSATILAESEQLDKIIAIVNDDIILHSSIENLINIAKIRNKNIKKQIINESTLRSQILERLITDKIILQIAEKIQIEIPDQTIDLNITNIAKQNGLTFNQLQKQLSMIGINFKNYRDDIHREIIISEVINNEVRRQIIILPQEVDSLVTQLNSEIKKDSNINLSHIMIPLSKNPTNKENKSAIDEIKKIFLKLNQGADFTKLSITYSINKNTLKNRKISWSKIEELPNIFA